MPYGLPEYDYAGGFKGEPIDVVLGEHIGVSIPALVEISLEGEAVVDEVRQEGPFGEWTGNYSRGGRPEPVIWAKMSITKVILSFAAHVPVVRPPTTPSASVWSSLR
ncbi:MAG: UbiD family decarboxylase [Desulfatiglandales bacterium]|nr:UbiD family decarboxylase [Desulfatiglandales bacterium]